MTALPPAGLQGAIVLWVDGAPLALAAGPDYTAWWPLVQGPHTFQAVATLADGGEVRSASMTVLVE